MVTNFKLESLADLNKHQNEESGVEQNATCLSPNLERLSIKLDMRWLASWYWIVVTLYVVTFVDKTAAFVG